MSEVIVNPTHNHAIPEGYKHTEIGVIPEDWVVSTIQDISLVPMQNGLFYEPSRKGKGIPLVNVSDMYTAAPISVDSLELFNATVAEIKSFQVVEGDLFFTRSSIVPSGIAFCNVYNETKTVAVFDSHLIRVRVNPRVADYRFIYLNCLAKHSRQHFISNAKTATMTTIDQKGIRGCPILLPPLKEQTAIANALSDVDALLTKLEKLIAKKQAIKTATMQQLLTGKTRLPQFATYTDGERKGQTKGMKSSELGEIPEDWEVYVINDVVDSLSSGATPFRGNPHFYKGINRWITSGELNYGLINDTYEKISDEAIKKANLKVHPVGTFLMAITGLEAAGTRGACGIVGQPATTNQSCMAIYTNKHLVREYLFHWYVYNGDQLALRYCQGTKQLSYTAGLLRTLPIVLPKCTKEQTTIANILSDMDAEIQALEQRLDKTRQIKQGMMQELLTGRTRLPFDAASKGEE